MAALAAGYILVALFMAGLGFNFMQGDAVLYWEASFHWESALSASYGPLYLLVLAALRTVTFGLVPPLGIMMGVNVVFLLVDAWLIHRIGTASGAPDAIAVLAALLFGLWPLVGLTYTVFPKTDTFSIAIFLTAIYLLQRGRPWAGAAVMGGALLAHNAFWPMGPLVIAGDWVSRRPRSTVVEGMGQVGLVLLPLGILWLVGTIVRGSPTWIVGPNLYYHVESQTSLPILDGAVGTFLRGGLNEITKGFVLAGFAGLAAGLIYACLRYRPPMYLVGAAIAAVIVLMWLILNSFEIWGMARFTRLLALPLLWIAAQRLEGRLPDSPRWRAGAGAALGLLALSQFVYAWYMVKVFYV